MGRAIQSKSGSGRGLFPAIIALRKAKARL